ncbi:PLDc N-terminal domain-containing protein [Homoserinibacter sp. GY 40078]|uniref:PLDc N-terminal domain-containing protein n=1 Tax=Homoserinibacter sp. GY 40078 TaxID=2603275 RepID=UPI0011C889BF|nr:PLDc N-terminal domain-containing protein [Homoserinibacter sp. GY 40078]TXK18660.1 hypothetical protein FVQ89_01555 [Homoserinibacter sp. GY 40078]
MNPLIPGPGDVVMTVLAIAAFVVSCVAIVSLSRTRQLPARRVLLWALVILLLPVLGAVAWLVSNDRTSRQHGAT